MDHNGDWILGFTSSLGCGEVLHADTKTSGKIIVESDSDVLVHLMTNDVDGLHPLEGLLNNCTFLQSQFQEIEIHHIYREQNMVADSLSKCSRGTELEIQFQSNLLHKSLKLFMMICGQCLELGKLLWLLSCLVLLFRASGLCSAKKKWSGQEKER